MFFEPKKSSKYTLKRIPFLTIRVRNFTLTLYEARYDFKIRFLNSKYLRHDIHATSQAIGYTV